MKNYQYIQDCIFDIDDVEITKVLNSETNGRYSYGEGNKYFRCDDNKWIGCDNETGDAWVEEFDSEEDCIKWLLILEDIDNIKWIVLDEEFKCLSEYDCFTDAKTELFINLSAETISIKKKVKQ